MTEHQASQNMAGEQPGVRLAEVVASLTLATDLATGQPLEHGLRRTLLAIWLGEELGIPAADLSTAYYVALLGAVGCILDGAAFADYVKDEIATRQKMVLLDPSKRLQVAAFFFGETGGTGLRRLKQFFTLSGESQKVCRDVALQVGGLLDLGPDIKEALGQCDEHWNGREGVLGLKGEEIRLAARLFMLAHDVEVFNRVGGPVAAIDVVRQRAGVVYDPVIAQRFVAVGQGLMARLQVESAWDSVLEAEPRPWRTLRASELNDVATKLANFIDMRSSYTVGHSPAVAGLAAGAARILGLPDGDVTALGQAGLLHDLGRAAVPATVWNKTGPLSSDEWERVKRHSSLTELVLARSSALGPIGTIAGLHHEKLDGTGYRGLSAASLPLSARILAVADCYEGKLELRPHRGALSPAAAAEHVRAQAKAGVLDPDVVEAVLSAAGRSPARAGSVLPAGLTEREAEVLGLVVKGLSNRQIAETLVVSPKTVGHHIENIYNKIGVSTRVGATLFAVQHSLVEGRKSSRDSA
jgi:HD-GYP domain-containing protein (c-di-GMP phosphodiesterase class II)